MCRSYSDCDDISSHARDDLQLVYQIHSKETYFVPQAKEEPAEACLTMKIAGELQITLTHLAECDTLLYLRSIISI
jgi:hypothetical protein